MTDLALQHQIEALLEGSLGRVCTAAVAVVARGRSKVCRIALGNTNPESAGDAVTVDTPFDLASLTKLFTGAAALRLVADHHLGLDDPVQRFLPDFRGPGKERATVRHLLTHTSGLPPGPGLYTIADLPDPTATLLAVPLSADPGLRVVYSDTGFMVLGLVVQVASGQALDVAVQKLVCGPLRMHSTGFHSRPKAAATELHMGAGVRIHGEVHDENAATVGGVAGHAGLFGTARDVVALAHAFAYPDMGFLPPALIAEAITEQAAGGAERRGLAWKLRSPLRDAPERAFSAATFGHYGFTGTAVWHDPARDTTAVLLTNRVYYGRDPDGIRGLRTALFDLVAAAIPARDGRC